MRKLRGKRGPTTGGSDVGSGCRGCGLAGTCKREVIGRGVMPADLLFVGEGPGRSEDMLGKAFVGPSGRLLDNAMEVARKLSGRKRMPTFYISNVVRCRPCDSKDGPNRQPTGEEAWACRPNLEKIYVETHPQRVILLGKIPEKYCLPMWPGAACLRHPAYLLRLGGRESTEFRTFVRGLAHVFESLKRVRKIGRS